MVIEWVRPQLADFQTRLTFADIPIVVTEAGTKNGKTVTHLVWLLERCLLGREGRLRTWVAPIVSQSKIAFRRAKRGFPAGFFQHNDSELSMTFPGDRTIIFRGSDRPDSLYGDDYDDAVMDEASRSKEEAYHAVQSTLTATGGYLRVIGNVKGTRNWAYKLGREARMGAPGMAYQRWTCWDAVVAGFLSRENIERMRARLPTEVFAELFLAQPMTQMANPMGWEALSRCALAGPYAAEPKSVGIDLGSRQTETAIVAVDGEGRMTDYELFRFPWRQTRRRIVDYLRKLPRGCVVVVDETGVGVPVLEDIRAEARGFGVRIEGYRFTTRSRQELLANTADRIQTHRAGVFGPVLSQLELFEYDYTGQDVRFQVEAGERDDAAMAFSLALWGLGTGRTGGRIIDLL